MGINEQIKIHRSVSNIKSDQYAILHFLCITHYHSEGMEKILNKYHIWMWSTHVHKYLYMPTTSNSKIIT